MARVETRVVEEDAAVPAAERAALGVPVPVARGVAVQAQPGRA